MDYFTIHDYSFESPEKVDTFKATILVINDRRIYADDFDDDDRYSFKSNELSDDFDADGFEDDFGDDLGDIFGDDFDDEE